MSNTQQNPSHSHSPRAGYYPDHERVIKLDRLADGITELVAHLDDDGYWVFKGRFTPETSIPQWHGEHMDNGTAVDMLLGCELS